MQNQNKFQFQLEKGSKKHTCPNCQKKSFVRYVDTENSNQYLPEQYGRCDREIKCEYHLNPYKDNFLSDKERSIPKKLDPQKKERIQPKNILLTEYIPDNIFNKNSGTYNPFATFLKNKFGIEKANQALLSYKTGSFHKDNHFFNDTVVFWQIDILGNVRAGKVIKYDPYSGKRIKDKNGKPLINWVYKLEPELKSEFQLKQCLFGEHLLALPENKDKTVCIVESEKTAIIASIQFPEFVWLATGGIHNLRIENIIPFAERQIFLIPELDAIQIWKIKANHFPDNVTLINPFRNFLNLTITQIGYDLADFILQYPDRIKDINFDTHNKPLDYIDQNDYELNQFYNLNDRFTLISPTGTGKTSLLREVRVIFCPNLTLILQENINFKGIGQPQGVAPTVRDIAQQQDILEIVGAALVVAQQHENINFT